jgi:hypothetical protein
MLNLEAPIVPSIGAAGVLVGTEIRQGLDQVPPDKLHKTDGLCRYDFGPVRVWVRGAVIEQIGVSQGYKGLLNGVIGVGATIAEVERHFNSPVEEDDEDNLIVRGATGWCFETEEWHGNHSIRENFDRCIAWIFVFATTA